MKTEFMNGIINVMCCGNVDDGKSTFLGRLLYETGGVHSDAIEDMEQASLKYSMRREYSMLLDGLLEERQQQITIDVAYRYLNYKGVRVNILDCPGHVDFLPGVISSAAVADCAILVIDVSKPISEQTIRHFKYLCLFQVKDVFVVFNKYDEINYNKSLAQEAWEQFQKLTDKFKINKKAYFVSALEGSAESIVQVLDDILCCVAEVGTLGVIHVQGCVLDGGRRVYHGKSMGVTEGEKNTWMTYPEGREITLSGGVGSIGNFCINEDRDLPRGSCISTGPLCFSDQLRGQFISFGMGSSSGMLLRHGTTIAKVLNFSDHHIIVDRKIAFNNINELRDNGFALLIDDKSLRVIGVFVFLANEKKREKRNSGKVIWLTGLSGTGKTTLGKKLQEQFTNSILLDADDIRTHVNFDLGYTPEELQLNVQKIAGIAKLISDQGITVIVCCISKFRKQREMIRSMFSHFYEIHMDTSAQDAKGLYASLGDKVISNYEKGSPERTIYSFDAINMEELKEDILWR